MNHYANPLPTILIIDDDKEDCDLFKEAIAKVSPLITVICSEDTDGLLEVVEHAKPSLIFMEYKLPREDGIECVRLLKAHAEYHHLPVIMWSTGNLFSVVGAAYNAGVQAYLQKPWDLKVWVQVIINIFRQNRIVVPAPGLLFQNACNGS